VAIDKFTKWIEVKPVTCPKADRVLDFLDALVEGPIRRPERGGSEREPIKILLLRENSAYTPKFTTKNSHTSLPRSRSHYGRTNPRNKPQTIPKGKHEAKDLADLQQPRWTVRTTRTVRDLRRTVR
jgi:hypothetical protein